MGGRSWPAVLMHTLFAAVIVLISEKTRYNLSVPNVMLVSLSPQVNVPPGTS